MMVVPEKTGPERGSFIEGSIARRPCWSCEAEIADEYSCSHCSVIQTFLKEYDYFRCFELGYFLQIDLAALEQQYYKLSRKFHPDHYQQKSPEEQAVSLENTALLTQAYRTLKDPLKRAAYLIRLVEGETRLDTQAPAALFEDIFEIQERLEAIRNCDPGDNKEKKALSQSLEQSLNKMLRYQAEEEKALEALFDKWDRLESSRRHGPFGQLQRDCIAEIKTLLSHRAYVDRVIGDIQAALAPAH